ncbi:MAG: hypothetical protein KA419_06085 [Acidobacteria bacterium]|nr:hypothetical protein [Acidobacteriota bacterium]
MPKIDKEAIKALAKEHRIALYSAKMILKGKWTVEYALTLERPVFNQGVSWLLQARTRRWLMAFRTFDLGVFVGKILRVRKFNVLLEIHSRLRYIEKIDTAYVYNARLRNQLPEYIKAEAPAGEKPAYKPSMRPSVDLSALREGKSVRIQLLTGEKMEGVIRWATEFDFELRLDRFVSIMVLNHAVLHAEEKEYHKFRQPPGEPPFKKPFGQRPQGGSRPPFRSRPFPSPSGSTGSGGPQGGGRS